MAQFDVEKDAAKVKFILEKAQVSTIVAEVVATMDLSGSTQELYARGTMQEAIQRVVPVALNFDDNGELPVYGFNDGRNIVSLPVLTAKNFNGYVLREILDKDIPKWGGTDYAPVFKKVLEDLGFIGTSSQQIGTKRVGGFFGFGGRKEPEMVQIHGLRARSNSGLPAIVYHFTDGENTDKKETLVLLAELARINAPIYFNCVGVGHATFTFLQKIADDLPNVEFTAITDLAAVANSDAIYDHLIPAELLVWLKSYVKVA